MRFRSKERGTRVKDRGCHFTSRAAKTGLSLLRNQMETLATQAKQNSVTDVSVSFRPSCWCSSGWAPAWRLRTNLYKFSAGWIQWVNHFFGYLVFELYLWPKSWRGSLYIHLLSFPRFWTLSIEWFWFLFWSILNGVTLKTSNCAILGHHNPCAFLYLFPLVSGVTNSFRESL